MTTGTVQDSNAGSERGAGRGVVLISSGESSGAVRSEGSSRSASPGLPAYSVIRTPAGAAKGGSRADRSALLGLVARSLLSSAHQHKPSPAAPNPCRTNMPDPSRAP